MACITIMIMKKIKNIALTLFLLLSFSSHGQEQLAPEGYQQWHYLGSGQAAPKGDWLTYFKKYPDTDTLFLKHIPSGRRISYPHAANHLFTDDGGFFIIAHNDSITILNLQTNSIKHIMSAGYLLAANKHNLVLYDPEARIIEIFGVTHNKRVTITNVAEAKRNPAKEQLLLVQRDTAASRSKAILLDYKGQLVENEFLVSASGTFTLPAWEKAGKHLAFFKVTPDGYPESIMHYNFSRNTEPRMKELMMDKMPGNLQGVLSGLFISHDGERVFFDLVEKTPGNTERSGKAVLWTTATKVPLATVSPSEVTPKKWVWFVNNGAVRAVESLEYPNAILSGDHKYAVVFNDRQYLPAFKFNGEYNDYYLMDLSSGRKELILEKHPYDRDYIQMSPDGKYVLYFKESHWWAYNIAEKKHSCLTAGIEDSFFMADYDMPGIPRIYAPGGWKASDKGVYLQGQYDVWEVATDGSSFTKITNGVGTKVKFKMYDDGILVSNGGNLGGFNGKVIDEDNILLYSVNSQTLAEGYYVYTKKEGVVTLKSGDRHYYGIRKVPTQQKWIFFESDFDKPAVLYVTGKNGKPQAVAKGNEQQKKYRWGNSELIYYTANNKELKGALFYPAGYDPKKKYPMVVYIYERLSSNLHKYSMPSLYTDNGVNITNFTLNGYFVLCPDISYALNEPGKSALGCVTAAVKAAVVKGNIDTGRMGLIGHSFGGYETSFIIGHTNLFKVAVAGAAITDLRSHYLFTNKRQVNLNNFERFQYRTILPYTDPKFEANAPINFADKIETPLLLWTSDQDPVVSPLQSIALQTALWRMGKPSALVLYPQDDHSLMDNGNQKDLTEKVLQWFGYYLKDEKVPAWMD